MMSISFTKFAFVALVAAAAFTLSPAATQAQQKSRAAANMTPVPAGGCVTSNGAVPNNGYCVAACNEFQWCPVQWCVNGTLTQTVMACYDPTGMCTPKC